MAADLSGLKVAFLVANEGIEQAELVKPWEAILQAGATPVLISPSEGKAQAMNHLELGDSFDVDQTTAGARPEDFAAVVLPGGVANPDQLRMDSDAIGFLKAMFAAGKPAAVICHGPWSLVEAGLVKERTLTSWPSLRTDITNAGGRWVDEELQVCKAGPNTLISSRNPDDLPAFCQKLVEVIGEAGSGPAAA